jgi:hypothetical protein
MQLCRWAFVHMGVISKQISATNVALNLET